MKKAKNIFRHVLLGNRPNRIKSHTELVTGDKVLLIQGNSNTDLNLMVCEVEMIRNDCVLKILIRLTPDKNGDAVIDQNFDGLGIFIPGFQIGKLDIFKIDFCRAFVELLKQECQQSSDVKSAA